MTEQEYKLLSMLPPETPIVISTIWQAFGPANYSDTKKLISMALKRGWVTKSDGYYRGADTLTITIGGVDALSTENEKRLFEENRLNEKREDRAYDKANKKTDRKFQLFSAVIGAAAGSAITLFFEHIIFPLFSK